MSLKKLADALKKQAKEQSKTTEERFLSAVDKYLVASRSRSEAERPQRRAFNPSSVYKCQRQIWYKLMGYKGKNRIYARSTRILEVGTALHEWVQREVFMEMDTAEKSAIRLLPIEELPVYGADGIEFIREHHAPPMEIKFLDRRFTSEIPVSAMVDGAFVFEGMNMLFEFKTINPTDYATLIEPLKDHIKQASVYSLCTGISRVMFIYFDKGTQNWRAFLVEYTPAQHEWVQYRLQTIEQYVLKEELPPKEESSQCRWCPFKKECGQSEGTEELEPVIEDAEE